jgi:hypothetical protein
MNVTSATTRPLNDSLIAQKQRAASAVLQKVLSPFEARMEKAFLAHRNQPLLRGFCNIFERNLTFDLDQRSYVWGDRMRMNTQLLEAIESATLTEAQKNQEVFWAIMFHCTYFVLGYQNQLASIKDEVKIQQAHQAFTQAVLQQMASLQVAQPSNAAHWETHGYIFKPLMTILPSATLEVEILNQIEAGTVVPENLTRVPSLDFSQLDGVQGAMGDFNPEAHESFAQEMLNDWVAEFTKCNTFGDGSFNGIRLLYFKSNPPRDASEAIMECLQSKYPVSDDLALYNNKKLANDYFAPKKADPIEEKTGHIELMMDCSGSISAADIANCIKVFTDFFAKKRKKMTYCITTFDTVILSRIDVNEDEDPNEKLKELAIIGGGGTDFRCTAAKIQELIDAGEPGPDGKPYRCDMCVTFTDLAGCFPDTVPCDYVWVTTTKNCDLGSVSNVPIPGTVIYL